MGTFVSLADYLRSFHIDNFAIHGDRVRIGARIWHASRCRCGEQGCDGWQVVPTAAGAHRSGDEAA
jgi:hypothetical protein